MQCDTLQRSVAKLRLVLITTVSLCSISIHAATDGSLGSSSEGTSVITIVKQDAVQISGVDDLEMGIRGSLTTNESVSDDVCVFSSTGGYNLTVTSANGAFNLRDDATNAQIPYALEWTTQSTQSVSYNQQLSSLFGNSNSLDCDGATNASFRVTITSANFNSANPGSYRDTVTLLVQPE